MTGSGKHLGDEGERIAAEALRGQGCRVLETNFRCKAGEIDIIAEDGGTVVFVEVKARTGDRFGTPQDAVTATKRARIVRAAEWYLAEKKWQERKCRFDVVSVRYGPAGSRPRVDVIRDAFAADG